MDLSSQTLYIEASGKLTRDSSMKLLNENVFIYLFIKILAWTYSRLIHAFTPVLHNEYSFPAEQTTSEIEHRSSINNTIPRESKRHVYSILD